MPDMKTALSSVLSQWEQDEKKQITQQQEKPMGAKLFKTTNNVTRETFNYIKNNPNKKSMNYIIRFSSCVRYKV